MRINLGAIASTYANDLPFPRRHQRTIAWAVNRARRIVRDNPPCNRHFQSLPNGRTLANIVADNTVFIHYNATTPALGLTGPARPPFPRPQTFDVAISEVAFRRGRWTVLATLIHELAHVNGAPGGGSHQAERALFHCGFGNRSEAGRAVDDPHTPYDPNITG